MGESHVTTLLTFYQGDKILDKNSGKCVTVQQGDYTMDQVTLGKNSTIT